MNEFNAVTGKTNKHKVTIVLIAILFVCATVSLTSYYSDAATINCGEDGDYTSLQDAVNAAGYGDTIVLTSDIYLEQVVTIEDDDNITLDLAGFEITVGLKEADRHHYAIDNYGIFTLMDSTGEGSITARGIENLGNGQMTINSGTIISQDENGGASVWNESNLTINGGTFETLHVGSSSDNVGIGCLNNSGNALITGGTFNDVNARTYAIISTGTIEITPLSDSVVVNGKHGGLAIDSGTAVINGGSYTSEDFYGLYVSNDGLGEDPMVAAVTVNGGTFDGKSYSVWLGSDYNDPVNSTLRINGGNFLNDINIQDVAREDAITVTGGIFSLDVSDYCIEGCNCVYSGSNYVVSHDIEPDSSGNVSLKATDSNTAFITTSYDVQTVDVQLARGSVSFESGTYESTLQVSIIPTHNTQESPELIATYELNIEGVSGFWVLVTFDAVITDGLVPMVYSTVNGVQVTEDVVSFTDSSVTIRTNHNTPFWILAVEPDEPSLNPGTDYDNDESLPPFIPQQTAGDDNTTLYIACCAAAAVVALLAIIIVMGERKR